MTKELISKHSKSKNKTAAARLRRILKHFIDTFSSDKDNLKKSAFKEHVHFFFFEVLFHVTTWNERFDEGEHQKGAFHQNPFSVVTLALFIPQFAQRKPRMGWQILMFSLHKFFQALCKG